MFRTIFHRISFATTAKASLLLKAPPVKFASFFLASTFLYNFTHNRLTAHAYSPLATPKTFITTEEEDDGPAEWASDGKRILTVCVTGAAGALSHSFLPLLVNGDIFGPNVKIRLRLLDIPQRRQGLKGIAMELEDCIFPLLENIKIGSDPRKLFRHCDLVICLAGAPRRPDTNRLNLVKANGRIYKEHGQALNEVGKKDVKCVVVAQPVNTNCSILQQNASKIPAENFTCSTRLAQNRAIAQLSLKTNVPPDQIENVIAWGNHSNTIYPDINSAKLAGKTVRSILTDDKYLNYEFVTSVQDRGDEILQYRDSSSVLSGANSLKDHIKDWWQGTEGLHWTSMGVVSDGAYGVPKGLVFSFPCVAKNFRYRIVRDIQLDDLSKRRMQAAVTELKKEWEVASEL